MIGSIIKLGLLGTLIGGSTLALVGSDRLKAYVEDGKDTVLGALDEARGMESKLDLIRSQIRGLDGEVRDFKEDAIRGKVEVDSLRQDIAQREDELARKARVLETARALLAEGRNSYSIGRVSYSRDAIESDAAEKLALFNVQAETLNSLRETLATKENALSIAEQNVGRAAALRVELDSKVGLLEAKLQKFRAKQHFAATAGDLIDTDELDSDLARAREMIADFEQDLEVKARMLEEQLKMGSDQPSEGIDYETLDGSDQDLSSRIGDVLRVWGDGAYGALGSSEPAVH